MGAAVSLHAVVLVSRDLDRRVTGVTLSERGHRVVVRAGVADDRVHLVHDASELHALRAAIAGNDVLFVNAIDQVVAKELVEPLALATPGTRAAFDAYGFAGAIRCDAATAERLFDRSDAFAALAARDPAIVGDAERVDVNRRARHPAGTRDELRAATRWQFELVNKPLDAFMTRRFWRPVARPFTRLFVNLPFTPNMISVACLVVSAIGGLVAAGATWERHMTGMGILFGAAILDNVDGEVARLRLESSNLGGWLDTIGDDVARVATIVAVGFHAAYQYPEWPVREYTYVTLATTGVVMGLIYWWCVFVGKTFNNQDYTKVLGVGPGINPDAPKSLKQTLADLALQTVRRDFIDVGAIVIAAFDMSIISIAFLGLGSFIGMAVTIPMHVRIVRAHRAHQAQQAAV
jgi:phosphatidylglycerophosphate synthase